MRLPEESAGRCLAPVDGVAASLHPLEYSKSFLRMHERELRYGGISRGLLQPSMTSDIVASGTHKLAGLPPQPGSGTSTRTATLTSRHDRTISALAREWEGTWTDSSISWS